MDIFKFRNPTHPTKMEQGEIINGLKSKLWVERYFKEGEFKLIGYADSGLRDLLPEGTYISHVDTEEIMIVEDHAISTSRDKPAEIVITGRSFPTFLEQRPPGANRTYPVSDGLPDMYLAADQSQDQMVSYIRYRFVPGYITYVEDGISYLTVGTDIVGGPAAPARYIKVGGDGWVELQKMLSAYGFSIRTIRPGPWSRANPFVPDENFTLLVYKGQDLSDVAVLSYDMGEIESADYFWSIRSKKTQAFVTGKWVGVRIGQSDANEDRRILHVDATNIDSLYSAAPTGTNLTQIREGMETRGLDALSQHKETNIVSVNVSKEGTHLKYRDDYRVGDIITVQGEYNATAPCIVTEYVESEDENGASGYPTLVPI